MYFVTIIAFGAIGTCFVSFTECRLLRNVKHISWIYGRSHCDSCGHILAWYELIPIFSWILLKGKCHKCGAKIGATTLYAEVFGFIYGGIFGYLALTTFATKFNSMTVTQYVESSLLTLLLLVWLVASIYDMLFSEVSYFCVIAPIVLGIAYRSVVFVTESHYGLASILSNWYGIIVFAIIMLVSTSIDLRMQHKGSPAQSGWCDTIYFMVAALVLSFTVFTMFMLLTCILTLVVYSIEHALKSNVLSDSEQPGIREIPEISLVFIMCLLFARQVGAIFGKIINVI